MEKFGVPFTTSMHSESWHSHLKQTLLAKKRNLRLDTLVDVLIQEPEQMWKRRFVKV